MKISYIFPTRSRPEKFFNCLDNISFYSESKDYEIICVFDEDDETMNNEEVRGKIKEYDNVKYFYGLSENKIAACNREVSKISPDTSIICLHSDDMWFIEYGFDNVIREAFKDWDGLVHFPDQKAGSQLITYAMMHRDYYNLHGYVYHPDFKSVYCDNYQQLQAQKLGKYKFVNKAILEHRHFIWGYGKKDSLLERTENPITYAKDKETFDRLKSEL